MFCRIDFVRLGEHTFNSSNDCQVGIEPNRTICSDPPVNITVQKVDIHPDFKKNPTHLKNDIGLIRLNEKVNYTGKSHFEAANTALQDYYIITSADYFNEISNNFRLYKTDMSSVDGRQ